MSLPALHNNADTRSITERVNVLIRLRNLLQAAGDLIVNGASGPQRLPLGTSGQVLTSDGTDAVWSALPVLSPPSVSLPTFTNQIAVDVALNVTSTFFTGPQVTQGTSGTWMVTGTMSFQAGAGADNFGARITDGTTEYVFANGRADSASVSTSIALSWVVTNPAGNLRMEGVSFSRTDSVIEAGSGRSSSIVAVRIG